MSSIVTVQITPVKEVDVYDVIKKTFSNRGKYIEHFDPNNYTPKQISELQKKGYEAGSTKDEDSNSNASSDSVGTTKTGTTSMSGASGTTGMMAGVAAAPLGKAGIMAGVPTTNAQMMGSGGTPQTIDQVKKNLQKGAVSNAMQNKNFVQSTVGPSGSTAAMSKKLIDADKVFNSLKQQVIQTNDMSVQKLRNEYETKINSWTTDYKKSIQAYKEYIKNQEKHLKEVESYNDNISTQLKRNQDEMLHLRSKWNECQSKINRQERELLQTGKGDSKLVKDLQTQLKKEKSKQGNLDAMLAKLRQEKEELDQAYEGNMAKLKAGGLGNNCPKGFNMNDYILKKNIPCWGCIL